MNVDYGQLQQLYNSKTKFLCKTCNDLTGRFVYLSCVPLFDIFPMPFVYFVTCGDGWFRFEKCLE